MGAQEEQAGCLISPVGSLSVAQLRLAGATEAMAMRGDLDILSLGGTLSPDGVHLQKQQPGHSGTDAAGPATSGHRHWLGPAQRCFRGVVRFRGDRVKLRLVCA